MLVCLFVLLVLCLLCGWLIFVGCLLRCFGCLWFVIWVCELYCVDYLCVDWFICIEVCLIGLVMIAGGLALFSAFVGVLYWLCGLITFLGYSLVVCLDLCYVLEFGCLSCYVWLVA